MSTICIRCTETQASDSPMCDAKDYANELTEENVKYTPDDEICINCANQYEREKWLKEATKSGDDCESNEQALQALREDEERLAD